MDAVRRAGPIALLVSMLCGCGGPGFVRPITVDEADDQQATCKVAKDPMNPLIIEWPGTSKVDLDAASQHGLVAVSYAGCTLKVLPSCNIGGKYELTKVTPARDRLEMSTVHDLYARLPLGAASLKAELATGSTLELDYIAVGQRIAEAEPLGSKGQCAGATHYVRTITIGAYSLNSKAQATASGGVEVANAGVGLGAQEGVKRVHGSGDVEMCAAKPEDPRCGAIIQLGLVPLSSDPREAPPVVAQTPPSSAPEPPSVSAPPPPPRAPSEVAAAPARDAVLTVAGALEMLKQKGWSVFGSAITLQTGGMFKTAKADLTDDAKEGKLRELADALRAFPPIRIEVHSDSTGSDEANMKLTSERATAMKAFLVSRGYPAEKIKAEGYGETRPISSNDTAAGRDQNRRIQIIVDPKN